MFNFNCWILGDDPANTFVVKIANSETVDDLKIAIQNRRVQKFDGIDAVLLKLWKVCC
jgi:hypothetical protein